MGNMYRKYLNLEEGYLYIPNNQPPEKCFPDKDLFNPHEQHYCAAALDGVVYDFDREWADTPGHPQAYIIVDTNGIRKPNKFGRDRFLFVITDNETYVFDGKVYNKPCKCRYGKGGMNENLCCGIFYLTGKM